MLDQNCARYVPSPQIKHDLTQAQLEHNSKDEGNSTPQAG